VEGGDAAVVESEESRINGVDDYMKWMYEKESASSEGTVAPEPEEAKIRGVDDYMQWMYNRLW
jgi:hypothetical protein